MATMRISSTGTNRTRFDGGPNQLTVRGRTVSVPPVSGDSLLVNLPGGFTEVIDTQFDTAFDISPSGTEISYEGATLTQWGSNVEDPTNSSSTHVESDGGFGTHALRWRWAENDPGPGGPGKYHIPPQTALGYRQLYFAMRIRFTPSYTFHSVGEKWLRPFSGYTTDTGSIGSWVQLGPGQRYWGLENPSAPFGTISSENSFPLGVWCNMEMLLQLNDPETNNAIRKIWVDNVLVVDESTYRFYDGVTPHTFDGFELECTRGGGSGGPATPTGGQWRDYDRFAAYGSVT